MSGGSNVVRFGPFDLDVAREKLFRRVTSAIDVWTAAAAITEGRVFRAINKAGRI